MRFVEIVEVGAAIKGMTAWGCRRGHLSFVVSKDDKYPQYGYSASVKVDKGPVQPLGDNFPSKFAAEEACARYMRENIQ